MPGQTYRQIDRYIHVILKMVMEHLVDRRIETYEDRQIGIKRTEGQTLDI